MAQPLIPPDIPGYDDLGLIPPELPPEWHGLNIPTAAPITPPQMLTPTISEGQLAPPDISAIPVPETAGITPPALVSPAAAVPTPDALPIEPAVREPFPQPSVPEIEERIIPGPEVPPEARAREEAAAQAKVIGEAKVEEGTRAADYWESFSSRMGKIQEEDAARRKQIMQRMPEIETQMRADAKELRELSRTAAAGPSRGAKAGFLIGAAFQAMKVLLGGGEVDTDILMQVFERDAEQKARAVQEARRRSGITVGERETELGKLQEFDYLKQVAIADNLSQVEADLRADAAGVTDTQRKLELLTAADRARAGAENARQMAMMKRSQQMLSLEKQAAEIGKIRETALKTRAERERLERRGRGTPGRQTVTEAQLRGLPEKRQREIRKFGVRDAGGDFFINPDGSFVLAGDATEAREMRSAMAQVQVVNDRLNELIALRNEYGMEWSALNSEARQAMTSSAGLLQTAMNKALELGALDEGGLRMIRQITGAGNPAGWYDKTATWKALQGSIESGVTRQLRAKVGYKGDFELPRVGEVSAPSVKEARSDYRTVYDSDTGRMGSTLEEREAGIENLRQAAALQQGSTEAGYEQIGAELQSYTERVGAAKQSEHEKVMARMQADKKAALAAGDKEKAARIDESIAEERKFLRRASILLTGFRQKLTEEAARRTAAERTFERTRVGVGLPVGGGQRAF